MAIAISLHVSLPTTPHAYADGYAHMPACLPAHMPIHHMMTYDAPAYSYDSIPSDLGTLFAVQQATHLP